MSRWCCMYGCTKDVLDHVVFVLDHEEDDGDRDELWEEVLPRCPKSLPRYAVNLVWEDIHRCLTDDFSRGLDFEKGEYPLRFCIHNSEWLRDMPRSVALVRAEEVPELCRALEAIDRAWLGGNCAA